jgi:hypothetical protein
MKKRWIVLRDSFLYYFKHADDPSPAGTIYRDLLRFYCFQIADYEYATIILSTGQALSR